MINFRLSGYGFINVGLPPASPSETEQDIVRWMDGWMNGRMDGWMDGWMNGWMEGWMGGWMDGWMDRIG